MERPTDTTKLLQNVLSGPLAPTPEALIQLLLNELDRLDVGTMDAIIAIHRITDLAKAMCQMLRIDDTAQLAAELQMRAERKAEEWVFGHLECVSS